MVTINWILPIPMDIQYSVLKQWLVVNVCIAVGEARLDMGL